MEYLSVAEARGMSGLRLVLSVGTPGPWGISARALFSIRGVPFVPVRQELMQPNEELVAWTGRRNAPVAVWNDEPAVDNWLDIMNLAERIGTGPSLFPDDPLDRALAVGFSAEICGAGGFGWSRRLMMAGGNAPPANAGDDPRAGVYRGYGMNEDGIAAAPARVVGILNALSAQLHRQRDTGSRYLVGDRLGACDVHWACFSLLVDRLLPEQCYLPEHMRDLFSTMTDEVRAALDPILIEHRAHVWQDYIGLPLDY
ncbi:MAG: hypothetical protein KDE55_03620 [Novosphingobium sp.]|nr:hypothetical protein [Novosphingobium sp.]